MRQITTDELRAFAHKLGLWVQHECGGYRVVHPRGHNVFPADGICPVTTRQACYTFLLGVRHGLLTGRKD